MTLDTEKTIYVCVDRDNAEVKVLVPNRFVAMGIEIVELDLSNSVHPDLNGTPEYTMLKDDMDEYRFET